MFVFLSDNLLTGKPPDSLGIHGALKGAENNEGPAPLHKGQPPSSVQGIKQRRAPGEESVLTERRRAVIA